MIELIQAMFMREIAVMPRRKYFYWKRLGAILIISFTFLANIPSADSASGLVAFEMYSYTAFFMLIFMTPLAACSTIALEKEQQTLELLLLSDLSSTAIILGKYFSQIFSPLLIYASSFPLAMFCISFGGIHLDQIAAVFCITLASVFFATSVGIFSAVLTSHRRSFGLCTFFLLSYFIIGTLIDVYMPLKIPLSPFTALQQSFEAKGLSAIYSCVCLQLAIMTFILLFAILGLSYFYYQKKSKQKFKFKFKFSFATRSVRNSSAPIKGNPITWKDCHIVYGSPKNKAFLCFTIALVSLFVADREFTAVAALAAIGCAIVHLFTSSLRAFSQEKDNKTLELLLATNLTSRSIVWGKVVAISKTVWPFWLLSVFVGIHYIFLTGDWDTFLIAVTVLFFAVSICSCAFFASLKCDSLVKSCIYTFGRILLWQLLLVFFFPVLWLLPILIVIYYINVTIEELRILGVYRT